MVLLQSGSMLDCEPPSLSLSSYFLRRSSRFHFSLSAPLSIKIWATQAFVGPRIVSEIKPVQPEHCVTELFNHN